MASVSRTFTVAGMTCDHCRRAVAEELSDLAGVTAVDIDCVPGGVSTVRVDADPMPSAEELTAAVAEAGDYTVAL